MIDLQEHQFELLPSEDASGGRGFGFLMDVAVDADGFHPGDTEWAVQDGQNAQRGTTAFGRDVLVGPEWGWDLFTNLTDVKTAKAAVASMATAWRAGRELPPGEVAVMRYRLGDEVRRIYGRPRNFSAPPNNRILSGFVPITTTFKCVDAFTYDDALSSVSLQTSAGGDSGGGFVFPQVFPVTSLPPIGDRQGALHVLGDADAFPVVRFEGPVVRPYLLVDGGASWRLDLDVTLTAGEYAVVDTRPWVASAVKNGYQGIGGKLGRRQWLSDMKFTPGEHALTFGAASGDNATCTVSWRSTWNSI